jgi:hypothetical protein
MTDESIIQMEDSEGFMAFLYNKDVDFIHVKAKIIYNPLSSKESELKNLYINKHAIAFVEKI